MVLVFMSDKISQSAPPVARMYPTNGMGVVPVPNSVDPNYYLSQDELLLYTPFIAGPDFRKKRINQLQKDVEKRINEILSILNQMLDSIR